MQVLFDNYLPPDVSVSHNSDDNNWHAKIDSTCTLIMIKVFEATQEFMEYFPKLNKLLNTISKTYDDSISSILK